ncbi:myosin heavy chain, clone 203-like [Mercenaria mercenaria]|uniref:myosin heavy chain, clone 203-like n=1 Tax=Mercenaria mercenaria TaxID=6596 RepID=UPI00234EDABC|nr:myosin heavy chain, clone 203-like [Mercenaria mercenaria]
MKTQEELEVKNIKITEFERREKERADEITKIKEAHSNEKAKLNGEIKSRQDIVTRLEKNLENLNWENTTLQAKTAEAEKKIKENERQYNKAIEKLYKENKAKIDALLEHHAQEIAGKNRQLNELALERDDMRNRFSKLAGDKLTNQNADIADLSDPNRAMKLSEKFGQLYDDEWTDAFEVLKGKKMLVKDAIQFLLDILQRCVAFCAKLRDTQMDSLKNVLLHPSQDVSMFLSEPRKHVCVCIVCC